MFENTYHIKRILLYAILKIHLIFAKTTYLTCRIYKPL